MVSDGGAEALGEAGGAGVAAGAGAGEGDAAGAGAGDAAGAGWAGVSFPLVGVWASATLAGRDRNRAVVNAMEKGFI